MTNEDHDEQPPPCRAPASSAADEPAQRLAEIRAPCARPAATAAGRKMPPRSIAFPRPSAPPISCPDHRRSAGVRREPGAGDAGEMARPSGTARRLELHLIGPLQSNKVADAVERSTSSHTVDRPKIAYALAQEMARGWAAACRSSSRLTPGRAAKGRGAAAGYGRLSSPNAGRKPASM